MYEQFFDQRPDLRIGDAERDDVAERLRNAHAEGRLDADELHERIDRCLKAKTGRELRELVADLPDEEDIAHSGLERRPVGVLRQIAPMPLLLAILAIVAVHGHGLFLLLAVFFLMRFMFRRGLIGRPRHRAGRGRADAMV